MHDKIEKVFERGVKRQAAQDANGKLADTKHARLARKTVSEIIEREFGIAPQQARPGSFSRRAYAAGMLEFRRDLRSMPATAADALDIRASVIVAAHRCCWRELRGRDGERTRFRSQVRCILTLTSGYAIWRSPMSCRDKRRQGGEWVGGLTQWQTERRAVADIGNNRGKGNPIARMPEGFGFDAVRATVLQIVNQAGSPVTIEALVAVLDKRFAKTETK